MRERHFLLTVVAVLAVASLANAGLTQITCDDDGDGVITMAPINDTSPDIVESEGGVPVYELGIVCNQKSYAAGHVQGDFTVDGDPIVKIKEEVTNDTSFTWTGYDFYIRMANPFSILAADATGSDWSVVSITAPALGTFPSGGPTAYVGKVVFAGGTPIGYGNTGFFNVKIQFTGTTAYCTEQTPTPEPATMAILGLGGMALLRRRAK